ncbi:polysaccharide deacetylase family protein [Clostridium fungisolvens]|uniref:polysaccharide deacetylase family protein n=1 Tax=Clostridium fungisolvens TaxID=1604897 RepID=UPI00160FD020|nr:polysaccharide deacetylase family protein [Clostridium fungisolvens]
MHLRKNKIIIFLLVVIVFISTAIASKVVNAWMVKKSLPIYSVDAKDKKISITFDINWTDEDNLGSILDIMKEYNVKGTFFIMGGWVNSNEENVEKLKKIKEGGNEIANHSYIHPDFTKISTDRMVSEIKKTEDIIYNNTGYKTKLFRCPSGSYNDTVVNTVKKMGYYCIQWDVDSVDWKNKGADEEYQRVIKNVKPGSILLFHNNGKYTPENLKKIFQKLEGEGYQFVPVGDLIYKDNFDVDNDGKQHKVNQ